MWDSPTEDLQEGHPLTPPPVWISRRRGIVSNSLPRSTLRTTKNPWYLAVEAGKGVVPNLPVVQINISALHSTN